MRGFTYSVDQGAMEWDNPTGCVPAQEGHALFGACTHRVAFGVTANKNYSLAEQGAER